VPGQKAPVFSLSDLNGRSHDLSLVKDRPMTILYFFDVDSRPSQEGLLTLAQISKNRKEEDLGVWAITRSPRAKVAAFATSAGIGFPFLLDTAGVDAQYNAKVILPTVCVIGPGLKVLDVFQGGGKTTEAMLARVAERTLQRRQTKLARAIGDAVIRKDPKNVKAKAVQGYASLRENDTRTAERIFTELSRGGEGEVIGKEGLAEVYAREKKTDKAIALAKEIQRKAPKRAYAHVLEGDILYARDRKKEAEAAYRKGAGAGEAEPYQQASGLNKLGRMYAKAGEAERARELYDKAVAIDPYFIEGTTNKGLVYEKQGQWDKALEAYRQAMALDRNDTFAVVLAKKAQEMLDLQKDTDRKKRVDQLVKDLAERFRSRKETKAEGGDGWTSGPMILSFVDIQEKGGLSERDGFSSVLTARLAETLNASGRVKVVERIVLDRLLQELNLGSSELADPEMALRLGKVLAARIIGTGSVFYMPQGTLLSLRLVDTETTGIAQVLTREIDPQVSLEKELFQINREILKGVMAKYPLRAFVARAGAGESMINIGSKQGVVVGSRFEVLKDGEAVTYKGKTLKGAPKAMGEVEVIRVEPELAYVKLVAGGRPLATDDKLQERIVEAVAR
jgi:tetratricopeptide (TPR) repeat protein